jgi:hypothetical protein
LLIFSFFSILQLRFSNVCIVKRFKDDARSKCIWRKLKSKSNEFELGDPPVGSS